MLADSAIPAADCRIPPGGDDNMAQADFTSRRLDVGGLSLHYLDWDGGGPPLVMLHGYTSHARDWDHTAAALSDKYRVLALDQRGHGDSEWASRYGVGLMADDLLAFLDALWLGQVTLMGLSMGGIAAFLVAASHPNASGISWS
jgi:pimeloyl-ACP methyl ester carboxylesterase